MGMGQSDVMPGGGYRYLDHIGYLDAWFEALGVTRNVILVLHDWGGALGFHRAARFPDQVAAIAYCEVMVRPRTWSDLPNGRDKIFKNFRTKDGERQVIDDNFFVETMMFEMGIVRDLTEAEKTVYRAPYLDKERRWPTLMWPREIPFDGDPADNHEITQAYSDFLAASPMPKLFLNTTGGHALSGPAVDLCRGWSNQTEVTLEGRHFIQEDRPHEFGAAVRSLVERVRG